MSLQGVNSERDERRSNDILLSIMFTQAKKILQRAQHGGYAVPAFDTSNLEITQAIIRGAVRKKSPLIIMATPRSVKYAGAATIVAMVKSITQKEAKNIPVALLLDHGKNLETVKEVIKAGFSSVMIDGSSLSFEKNAALTKKVVRYVHKYNVDVQGELGGVSYLGKDPEEIDWKKVMTDPDKAQEFVQATGVDTLAVAIGNAHGFFKERSSLDWNRLEQVHQKVSLPLVLHGASDFQYKNVSNAIKGGAACFNIDTALRVAFSNSLRTFLKNNPKVYDPREILGFVSQEVQKVVEEKIEAFGSAGKV